MKNEPRFVREQSGVMLLEALIAILIFSLGILAVVGMQAVSVKMTSDAKYRSDATLLANQLVGEMWASGANTADLKARFSSPDGADYKAWASRMMNPNSPVLPGLSASDKTTLPCVEVDESGQVAITIFWRTPEMSATNPPESCPAIEMDKDKDNYFGFIKDKKRPWPSHTLFSQIVRN